jgi:hypothetical protein
VQTPDHFERQRTPAVEYLVHAIAAADERDEVARLFNPGILRGAEWPKPLNGRSPELGFAERIDDLQSIIDGHAMLHIFRPKRVASA